MRRGQGSIASTLLCVHALCSRSRVAAGRTHGNIFSFEAEVVDIPATVDQADPTNKAIGWALGFYDEEDLEVVASEFRVSPTRFWLITLAEPNSDYRYFAVVLPDGAIVETRVLDRV